ncbi:protein rhiA [Serratia sp. NPDC078593]|uniref:protein rhiA n=1 Tax=unclassified Serratia (in: enterobacteria) TaxID=2647522 RepID=UPI0037D4659C
MTKYKVNFKNHSSNYGKACIYQTLPDIDDPNIMSLAWFSKAAHPNTNVQFDWNIDYSYVWDETGVLLPGVNFDASQVLPADLVNKNQVTLKYEKGAFKFDNLGKGNRDGTLYITHDSSLPLDIASVGIGMSGAGTFVVQAQPNLNLNFTPHPTYWIAFGNYTSGQVLDISEITNQQQLDFPPNVYELEVELLMDNTWSVKSVI